MSDVNLSSHVLTDIIVDRSVECIIIRLSCFIFYIDGFISPFNCSPVFPNLKSTEMNTNDAKPTLNSYRSTPISAAKIESKTKTSFGPCIIGDTRSGQSKNMSTEIQYGTRKTCFNKTSNTVERQPTSIDYEIISDNSEMVREIENHAKYVLLNQHSDDHIGQKFSNKVHEISQDANNLQNITSSESTWNKGIVDLSKHSSTITNEFKKYSNSSNEYKTRKLISKSSSCIRLQDHSTPFGNVGHHHSVLHPHNQSHHHHYHTMDPEGNLCNQTLVSRMNNEEPNQKLTKSKFCWRPYTLIKAKTKFP